MINRFQQSNAFIPPIASDADLTLYNQEVQAVQEEIALRNSVQETVELKAHNDFLVTQIHQYNANQQSWRMTLERKMVSPVVRVGWIFGLGAGIYLKETLKASAAILGRFLFPVHFAIDGARSIWDTYRLATEKVTAKRTQIGATLLHTSTLIAAATVVGLGVTAPFALPIIFTAMSVAGIYKSLYVSHSLSNSITAQANVITQLHTALNTLKSAPATELNQAEINTLKAGINRQQSILVTLKEQRFQARREAGINIIYQAAIGLLIGGIFFPPLAFVGMMVFASAGIANVIDWKTNNFVSRNIAKAWNATTSGLGRAFSALKNALTPSSAPVAALQASADNRSAQSITFPPASPTQSSRVISHVVQGNTLGFFESRKYAKVPYMMNEEENEQLLKDSSSPSSSRDDQKENAPLLEHALRSSSPSF